jgi:hypothetical protein
MIYTNYHSSIRSIISELKNTQRSINQQDGTMPYQVKLFGTVACKAKPELGYVDLCMDVDIPFLPHTGWLLSDALNWQAEIKSVDVDVKAHILSIYLELVDVDENQTLEGIKEEIRDCLADYTKCGWQIKRNRLKFQLAE